jgi:predicted ferric reductase
VTVGVLASGASSQTIWYIIRASGIIAFALLTLSVCAGLLITNRVLPSGQPRVDAFEVHNFTALLVFALVSVHLVALLLDTFIGFSVVNLFVPFTSSYRPVAVAGGILSLYVAAIVYASVWARRRIGYKTWRAIHFSSFGAFALAAAHGIFSGADSGESWMVAIYALLLAAVGLLTLRRILEARSAKPRSATA